METAPQRINDYWAQVRRRAMRGAFAFAKMETGEKAFSAVYYIGIVGILGWIFVDWSSAEKALIQGVGLGSLLVIGFGWKMISAQREMYEEMHQLYRAGLQRDFERSFKSTKISGLESLIRQGEALREETQLPSADQIPGKYEAWIARCDSVIREYFPGRESGFKAARANGVDGWDANNDGVLSPNFGKKHGKAWWQIGGKLVFLNSLLADLNRLPG